MNTLAAEVRKLWTVRTTWALTAVGWAMVGIGVSFITLFPVLTGTLEGTDLEVSLVIEQIAGLSPIVLVVGLLSLTAEFRHGTIGRSLQLVPGRTRLLVAKATVSVAYAAVFYVTSLVLVALLLWLGARAHAVDYDLGPRTVASLWQVPVGLALTAIFGVAFGALVRNQVVAITVSLVWLMLVESMVVTMRPDIGRWLPFQALDALVASAESRELAGLVLQPLAPGPAAVVFAAYLLAVSIPAIALLRYRDV